jgi:3-oxoacyl-[acyl-carrier-protein] synthase II
MGFPPPPAALSRRVVITGLGAVTPLGVGLEATWKRLINGECGISVLTDAEHAHAPWTSDSIQGLDCTIGGAVPPHFDPFEHIDRREARSQDVRFISFAIAAANEAIRDAKWFPANDIARERAGVAIGAGIGNVLDILETGQLIRDGVGC